MLHSGEQGGATLVDFGGAVRLGDPIVEVTDQFCLHVAKLQGSELLDWTCLGTTLAQLAGVDITKYHSRQDLVRSLKDGHEQVDHLVDQLIISCLENPSETRIKAAWIVCRSPSAKYVGAHSPSLFDRAINVENAAIRSVVSILVENYNVPPGTKHIRVCDDCFVLYQSEHAEEEEEKRRRGVLLNIDSSHRQNRKTRKDAPPP